MNIQPIKIETNRLSGYHSSNIFTHYAEFKSEEEYIALTAWARDRGLPLVILGNGSNVIFCRRTIETVVLKNMLPAAIDEVSANEIKATSSVPVARLIRWCMQRHLDSFYYLASVPATVGGAVAMNAGRGEVYNRTILDFVTSINYIENGQRKSCTVSQMKLGYRKTIFTGVQDRLITSVSFKFGEGNFEGNPGRERVAWSKEFQDYSAPNCGSVFKYSDTNIMRRLRGLRVGNAAFSSKTSNWLLYHGGSGRGLCVLIAIAKLIHIATFRTCELELIRVK